MERFRLLAFLLLSVLASPLFGAPPNDSMSQAEEISGTEGILIGTTLDATHEAGDPLVNGMETSAVWYIYTAPASGHVEIGAIDPATNFLIQGVVKTAEGFEELPVPWGYTRHVMTVEEGKRYYIGISPTGSSTPGPFQLKWQFGDGGLIYLTYNGQQSFYEDAGYVQIPVYRGAPLQNRVEVTYEIIPENVQPEDVTFPAVRTVVFEPGEDSKSIDLILHPDDLVEGRETFLIKKLSATGGAFFTNLYTVAVKIDDADDDPPNAKPENPGVLTGTFGEAKGTLAGANSEAFYYAPSVYYRWMAPATGTVSLTLRGPGWNTGYVRFLRVLEPRYRTEIFQQHPGDDPLASHGQFEAVEGEAYTIMVVGYDEGEAGRFTLLYDMDRDADGLPDSGEALAGTSPTDADSDDDGLPDGAELSPAMDSDGDGLINGQDPDSDGDGLYDGTEMGISVHSAGTNTLARFFIPDADAGATKTSMLLADSDGSGAFDGYEDANRNGAIDSGESDPNNPADDPAGLIRFHPMDYSALEGYSIRFLIERSGNPRGMASVNFSASPLEDSTGADWQDLIPQSETVTFADGELGIKAIDVSLLDDSLYEDMELFRVVLSSPSNAILSSGSEGLGRILDNDPYVASAGNYRGTFGSLNGPVGAFSLKLTPSGRFTGTLMHGQTRYRLRGSFAASGLATVEIPRSGRTPLLVDLRVTRSGDFLRGTVRESAHTTGYELTGGRLTFSAFHPALPLGVKSQKLTFLLAPGPGTPVQYGGTGHAVGTLTSAGNLRLAGRLPDGSSFSTSAAMDIDRRITVQQSLYRGIGGLYGRLVAGMMGTAMEGELGWVRSATPQKPGGHLSAKLSVQGFAYRQPARGELILSQLEGAGGKIALRFASNSGDAPLRIVSTLSSKHLLTDSNVPPSGLKGTASAATGLLRGSLQPPGAPKLSFSGVFIQATGSFEGLYTWLGTTRRVTSEPEPSAP